MDQKKKVRSDPKNNDIAAFDEEVQVPT